MNCDLTAGGVCAAASTGGHWCAYPDSSCADGYRYANQDVGDGLAGECLLPVDAGVDASPLACKRRVAFSDGLQGHEDIWVANPDGSGLVDVSSKDGDNINPSWSPDGLRIAFQSNREGNWDIFTVNYDGSGLVNLTKGNTTDDFHPVWSPDGTRIAFVRTSATSPFQGTVWMMNADGNGATQVSTMAFTADLAWSPAGAKLVFGFYDANVAPHAKVPLLYVAAVGSGITPTKLTSQINVGEQRASWTPGVRIAFDSAGDVITTDENGANLLNVTQGVGHNSAPRFTQNGDRIVFLSDRDSGHQDIWSINADGSNPTQITVNSAAGASDFLTDVSSDDLLLAYVHTSSPTDLALGVVSFDGTSNKTFNAPGASNAMGAKFSACP